jgi:hypothetical protein
MDSINGTENQKTPSRTSNVLRIQTGDYATTGAVATEGTLRAAVLVYI